MGRMLEVHEASGIESRQAERRLRDALSSELHSQEEMAERRAAQARDARWIRGWCAGIRAREMGLMWSMSHLMSCVRV